MAEWLQQSSGYVAGTPWVPTLTCRNGSTHTTIPWPLDGPASYWTYSRGIVNATARWTDWQVRNPSHPIWDLNDTQEWNLTVPPVAPRMNGASYKIVGVLEATGFPHGIGGHATVEYSSSLNRFKFLFRDASSMSFNQIQNNTKGTVFRGFFDVQTSWGINVRYEARP